MGDGWKEWKWNFASGPALDAHWERESGPELQRPVPCHGCDPCHAMAAMVTGFKRLRYLSSSCFPKIWLKYVEIVVFWIYFYVQKNSENNGPTWSTWPPNPGTKVQNERCEVEIIQSMEPTIGIVSSHICFVEVIVQENGQARKDGMTWVVMTLTSDYWWLLGSRQSAKVVGAERSEASKHFISGASFLVSQHGGWPRS